MARKRSASRNMPSTKSFKRDILQGGRGRGRRSRPTEPSWVQLLRRLRRVELAMAYSLSGKPKDFSLERFLEAVLQLSSDAEIDESRGPDQGGAVQVPQKGAPPGEGEGAPGIDWGPESRLLVQKRAEEATEEDPKGDD